jgi:hypothetical protein
MPLTICSILRRGDCRHAIRAVRKDSSRLTVYGQDPVIRSINSPRISPWNPVEIPFIFSTALPDGSTRPARGYRRYGRDPAKRYMHAWPEVFLPGGGWRGYDPTQSTLVTDHHVAVAASNEPAGAAPIQGAYFGESVPSKMEAWLQIGDQLPQTPIL